MALQPKNQSCANCRFYIESVGGGLMQCRANASMVAGQYDLYPVPEDDGWCGRWELDDEGITYESEDKRLPPKMEKLNEERKRDIMEKLVRLDPVAKERRVGVCYTKGMFHISQLDTSDLVLATSSYARALSFLRGIPIPEEE